MTKHITDESLQKCHIGFDEAEKMVETTAKALDRSTLFIVRADMSSEPEDRLRVARVKPKINSPKTKLGKSMQKLYDLDPDCEPEKQLNINFKVDLYQMEDF